MALGTPADNTQIASTQKNLEDLEKQLQEWEAYEKQLEELGIAIVAPVAEEE